MDGNISELKERKAVLESELKDSAHGDPELVATSMRHCGLQVEYWLCRQMLALAEADACDDSEEGQRKRKHKLFEASDCSKMAERWEARKNATATNARLDLLRDLAHKLEERQRAADRLRGGNKRSPKKAARPASLDLVYHITDEQADELFGWLLHER